jgi:hypothetical protein
VKLGEIPRIKRQAMRIETKLEHEVNPGQTRTQLTQGQDTNKRETRWVEKEYNKVQ